MGYICFLSLFCFLALTTACGQDSQPDASSPPQIEDWSYWDGEVDDMSDFELGMLLTYFYTKPKPELLPSMLGRLCVLFEQSDQEPVLEAFVASVAVAHPAHVADWLDQFEELDACAQRQMFIGLWLASSELEEPLKGIEGKLHPDLLGEFQWYQSSKPQPRVPELSNSPAMHDAMWAGYFADGERGYVLAIIAGLHSEDILTQSMANWSLTSNAFQHRGVLETCIEVRDETEDAELKTKLSAIIDEARGMIGQQECPEPEWVTDED